MFEFNLTHKPIASLLKDIKRAVTNRKVEIDDSGLMVIKNDVNVKVGGVFDSEVFKHDLVREAIATGDKAKETLVRNMLLATGQAGNLSRGYTGEQASYDHNKIPYAGINGLLDIVFGAVAKQSWYQGPFTSSSTPGDAWESDWANDGSATELTAAQFTGSARPIVVFAAASSQAIATSAANTWTLETGVSNISLYGSTLNSVATIGYSATDEYLMAATSFSSAKSGLSAADVINISYTISGTST